MDKKKPVVLAAITPVEMFTMIGDFADGLLHYMRENHEVDESKMNEAFKQMIGVFDTLEIEGRLSIIIMLLGACTTYEYSVEQEAQKCPKYLN